MVYDELLNEAKHHDIDTYEMPLSKRNKGLYADNVIWINKHLTTNDKICTLAEELGHYHTTVGNIIDQSKLSNRKQERQARNWAWNKLVTPRKFIDAYEEGCRTKYEIADFLNITEVFLDEGLAFYREKYGTEIQVDDTYTLFLEPLGVYKKI